MKSQTQTIRGRPREFDPEEALSAALTVFWRRGYEGASMAELTEAMGITKPSLYACFGNKESLFRKALDLYERDKLCYMKSALDAPTAKGVAERLLRGSLAIQTGTTDPHGCLGVISTVACTAQAESIRDDVIARRASSDAALAQRFERARAEGDFPEAIDPQALVTYLSTIMQGMAVQAGAGTARDKLEQLIETTLAVWPGK
ncbi:TetR/AcrR family transcriptional regulator [Sphingobium sp. EM0848]|uniref:TetR/AcrR family transcriptional regulator n=1 Tax=Sphingobium sp. EM0848 TaxID=2743473 RepID=UPI00159CC0D8|nr:TetR/AcrR family transcriptional regulator [Sphingobium sp. EM0848]